MRALPGPGLPEPRSRLEPVGKDTIALAAVALYETTRGRLAPLAGTKEASTIVSWTIHDPACRQTRSGGLST